MVTFTEDEHYALSHIGIKRKSGRYPWGTGEDPYQRSLGLKKFVDEAKSQGMTERQIADAIEAYANKGIPKDSREYQKISTAQLRAGIASSTAEIRAANQAMAYTLKAKGMSNGAIAERMGLGSGRSAESTVRGWLKHSDTVNEKSLQATADKLKDEVERTTYLDVGKSSHLYMGITASKLNTAVAMLQDEGYKLHPIKVPQLGTDKMTQFKILTKEDKTWSDAQQAIKRAEYGTINVKSEDGGLTFKTPKALPVSVDSSRIGIRYKEDGGEAMDGVVQLRRGVADIDLGQNRYAQVRIAVDGTHYIKGMAMYTDDLPPGIDMRFNTNKSNTGDKLAVMKPLKVDKATGEVDTLSPFGATTHSHVYTDKSGKEHTSPLNMVYEEGDWQDWTKSLSSQMLSKQPQALARRQLGVEQKNKEDELKAIMSLTNPVVKKKLLDEYAESADAAAVHLKAAAMPRQTTNVILPINTMRTNEIYAPGLDNGTRVALVRHPHGGPFEIPSLTVNNKNPEALRILKDAKDAVGIHHSVAAQLSGADFDGDTVLVIPNDNGQIRHRASLEGLRDFDPKAAYPKYEGMPVMKKETTQTEMGKISNLITDMTIKGATDNELARAIRHSMVVIDAEKHELNYKESALRNGIAQLKQQYQGGSSKGASTLISKASAEARPEQIRLRKATEVVDGVKVKTPGPIDPKTGELVYVKTGASYTRPVLDKKTGLPKIDPTTGLTKTEVVMRTTKTTQMAIAKDARELISKENTAIEQVYASHANSMKALANQARRESYHLEMPKVSKAAKSAYANEVASLNAKLRLAQRNAPLERRAQVIGNAMARQRINDNPGWDKDDVKRAKYQSLDQARLITGANKKKMGTDDNPITDLEWEAIQAGAVAHSRLSEILSNSDMTRIRELATPRTRSSLTPGQIARAKAMQASGKPMADIARELGIPRSTIVDNINK